MAVSFFAVILWRSVSLTGFAQQHNMCRLTLRPCHWCWLQWSSGSCWQVWSCAVWWTVTWWRCSWCWCCQRDHQFTAETRQEHNKQPQQSRRQTCWWQQQRQTFRALHCCFVTAEHKKVQWEVLLLHMKLQLVHYDSSCFILCSRLFVFHWKAELPMEQNASPPEQEMSQSSHRKWKAIPSSWQEMLFQKTSDILPLEKEKKLHFAVNVSKKENLSSLSGTHRTVSED